LTKIKLLKLVTKFNRIHIFGIVYIVLGFLTLQVVKLMNYCDSHDW